MDIERNSRNSRWSNYNHLEASASRLSALSIERNSGRQASLSHKASLIDAMDLEYPNDDDDFFMQGQNKRYSSHHYRSSHKDKDHYHYGVQIEQKDLNRKSNYKINHDCICRQYECEEHHCNCWLTPGQICVIGQCCRRCIQLKNQFLQTHKGYKLEKDRKEEKDRAIKAKLQNLLKETNTKNMHYMKQVYANQLKDLIFCTCKKSHCQKKYCLCYEKGLKCGDFCRCEECFNKEEEHEEEEEDFQQQRRWQRYAVYQTDKEEHHHHKEIEQEDIEQYLQNRMSNEGSFKETMEFQPVNFEQCFNSHH